MFIVEDGTGKPDATSYVAVEFADAYFAQFGEPAWASLTLDAKQAGLNAASQYFDVRWGAKLGCEQYSTDQAMLLPAVNLYNRTGVAVKSVPVQVQRACCEYALLHTRGGLYAAQLKQEGAVSSKKTTVGPITTEVSYQAGTFSAKFQLFPKADGIVQMTFSLQGSGRKGTMR